MAERTRLIDMARKAGFDVNDANSTIYATSECTGALRRFAELAIADAVAAERQAFAEAVALSISTWAPSSVADTIRSGAQKGGSA